MVEPRDPARRDRRASSSAATRSSEMPHIGDGQRAGADRQGDRGGGRAAQPERAGGLLMPAAQDHQGPDRQPRRDRRARDPRLPRARHRARSPSTPRPTARALHVRTGRRGDRHRPAAGARELPGHRQDPRRRPQARGADARPSRATASSPRTPTSPRRVRRGGRRSSSARRRRRSTRWATRRAARAQMQAAGVPVVPGDNGPDGRGFPTPASAKAAAARIGYPVMLKAAAGGGGRGMRLVDGEDKLEAALAGRAARGQGGLRRRHRLSGEGDRAAAPHRDPGVRRRARQRGPPLRARLLDPAPPPEGDRGVAVAGGRRRDCAREMGEVAVRGGARRSATSAPAPSSSSTTRRRAASTSWR